MLEAVIFDMDGVLLDSESLHYDVLKELMAKYGYDYTAEHFLIYCGTPEKEMWPRLLKAAALTELDPEKMLKEHWEGMREAIATRGLPEFKGTAHFLKRLKEHGLKIAVASASDEDVIRSNLKGLGIDEYFDEAISSTICEQGKPAPDVFLLAASRMGVKPENCLVVEDSKNGIAAAGNAGMACVGYAGARLKPDMSTVKHYFTDYDIMTYEQLIEWYEEYHK